MIFSQKARKVIIDTLSQDQAIAFIAFLCSEIIRHQEDIVQASEKIQYTKELFDL